ncbi:XTP/dITP diphosphatase [Moorella sulfitireducens (nom. illeg.)]|uniref:XTP/dITP diphosphatase n=1 Tax=Neomoorella sulfitireducens TaxID=2972948 RepID=UPI0021AC11E2|nr:XTP/dITP diphosphatase [Moorella sulfitireducens]
MSKLVVATQNEGKAREFRELLRGLDIAVASLKDFPGVTLPEETGTTFTANALLKARKVAENTGLPALADDSGLEVDFLKGAPGIYSARFAGMPSDDRLNNIKLLQLLAGVPWEKRTARFRCALALVIPNGDIYLAEGTLEGIIAYEPRGNSGFGYDPLVYLPEYGKTVAELGEEIKNNISHRARAVKNLWPVLSRLWPGKPGPERAL